MLTDREEAQEADAVVEGDNDNVVLACQRRAIAELGCARSHGEGTAVNPEQHGEVPGSFLGPDVERQTVFGLPEIAYPNQVVDWDDALGWCRSRLHAVAHAGPAAMLYWRAKAQLPERWFGKGNS